MSSVGTKKKILVTRALPPQAMSLFDEHRDEIEVICHDDEKESR